MTPPETLHYIVSVVPPETLHSTVSVVPPETLHYTGERDISVVRAPDS